MEAPPVTETAAGPAVQGGGAASEALAFISFGVRTMAIREDCRTACLVAHVQSLGLH